MNINLLSDPVFQADTATGRRQLDLPGVLEGLSAGEIAAFPRLRPHQAPYFHMLLCQLAALALAAAGARRAEGVTAGLWRDMIRKLTPGFTRDEPWNLVDADLSRPAFLQPPVVEGSKDGKAPAIHLSPDEIDLVGTTRGHAQKVGHPAATIEHWIHALICRQTAGGYYGKFNYGVMRAPGSDHPRYLVGLVPSLCPSARFRRDVAALIATRNEALAAAPFLDASHRIPFLWTLPWNGDDQLAPSSVGPWTIEAGLRLRLVLRPEIHAVAPAGVPAGAPVTGDAIACERRMNSGRRISEGTHKSQSLLGRMGDPWGPTYVPVGSTAGLEGGRPTFEWVAKLIFDPQTYALPALAMRVPEVDGDRPMWLRIEGIHSKDGKTSWAEKTVSVPLQGRFTFNRDATPAALDMLADIQRIHQQILMPAMMAWFDGDELVESKAAELRRTCYPVLRDAFSARVEAVFFACAAEAATDAPGALSRWREAARSAIPESYEAFLEAMPARESSSRWRRARGVGALRSLIATKFVHPTAVSQVDTVKPEGRSGVDRQRMTTSTRRQTIQAAVRRIVALVANQAVIPPAQFAQIEGFDTHSIGPRVPVAFWKVLGHAIPSYAQGDLESRDRMAWLTVVKAAAIASRIAGRPASLGHALQEAGYSLIRYSHLMDAIDAEDRRQALDTAMAELLGRGIAFRVDDVAFLLLLEDADLDAELEKIDRDFMGVRDLEAA